MTGKLIWLTAVLLIFSVSLLPQPVLVSGAAFINCALISAFILSLLIHRREHCDKTDALVLLFVFFAFCGVFLAEDNLLALRRFNYSLLPIVPTYFIFKHLPYDKRKNTLRIIYILASVISVYCIVEFIMGRNFLYEGLIKSPYYGRALYSPKVFATLYHPTIVGVYLTAAAPLSYLFAPDAHSRTAKVILILSLLLNLTAILLTFSKMAWLVTAMLVFLFVLKILRRARAALIVVLLVLMFFIGYSLGYIKRDITDPGRLNSTLGHRANSYFVASQIILRYPVFGIGLDHYRRDFMDYSGLKRQTPDLVKVPDNNYMAILAEMGLAAFIPFMLFVAVLLKRIAGVLRRAERYAAGAMQVAVSLSLAGMFLFHLSYDSFYWGTPLVMFWMLAGIFLNPTLQRQL
ncbi:MAG: O-antigen ligase family protein [Candidatus Omnitrophica bacterium]|nr:O-antigen ligase family protein [Candidatus Omnitrophota bacterium]